MRRTVRAHPLFRIGLALIAAGLSWQMFRSSQRSQQAMEPLLADQAEMQLTQMKLSVASYLVHAKRPLPLNDAKLLDAISGGRGVAPMDPWGTPIRYRVTEPQPGWFYLMSAGPDRAFDTSDDIVVEHPSDRQATQLTTAPASQPR